MSKKEVTPQCLIPVRQILIVGANVGGRANFLAIGGVGLVSSEPPMIALPIRHGHYTLKGIFENRTFSVNIPTTELVKEADYCGIVSGEHTDKVTDCNFDVFYGKLSTAPMIEQCPINMECTMFHTIGSNSHKIVIGQINGTYVSRELLVEEKLDLDKISPLLWFRDKNEYIAAGNTVGKSHNIGNVLKKTP